MTTTAIEFWSYRGQHVPMSLLVPSNTGVAETLAEALNHCHIRWNKPGIAVADAVYWITDTYRRCELHVGARRQKETFVVDFINQTVTAVHEDYKSTGFKRFCEEQGVEL